MERPRGRHPQGTPRPLGRPAPTFGAAEPVSPGGRRPAPVRLPPLRARRRRRRAVRPVFVHRERIVHRPDGLLLRPQGRPRLGHRRLEEPHGGRPEGARPSRSRLGRDGHLVLASDKLHRRGRGPGPLRVSRARGERTRLRLAVLPWRRGRSLRRRPRNIALCPLSSMLGIDPSFA